MNQDTSVYVDAHSPEFTCVILRKWRETRSEHTAWVAFISQETHSLQALSARTVPDFVTLEEYNCTKYIKKEFQTTNLLPFWTRKWDVNWELTSWWQVREDKIWSKLCKTLPSSPPTKLGSVILEGTSGLSSHPKERLLQLRICWNWERQ